MEIVVDPPSHTSFARTAANWPAAMGAGPLVRPVAPLRVAVNAPADPVKFNAKVSVPYADGNSGLLFASPPKKTTHSTAALPENAFAWGAATKAVVATRTGTTDSSAASRRGRRAVTSCPAPAPAPPGR